MKRVEGSDGLRVMEVIAHDHGLFSFEELSWTEAYGDTYCDLRPLRSLS